MSDVARIAQLFEDPLDEWADNEITTEEFVTRVFDRLNVTGYLLVRDPDNTNPPNRVWLDELVVDLR